MKINTSFSYHPQNTFLRVILFVLLLLTSGQCCIAINPAWMGESAPLALCFSLGHEFAFVDYASPFYTTSQMPLTLTNSLTQQYSLLVSDRTENPLHIGRGNRHKYLELGFGFNVLHRYNKGEGMQEAQVITKSDSTPRIAPAVRTMEVSNLSFGISGIADMPTYIVDKLRIRFEPDINMIVWDKTRSVLSLSDNDTSVVFPRSSMVSYSPEGRVATRESAGDRTYEMVYSLKIGLSYSFQILLRSTPWLYESAQYGEIQPYINYTLRFAPTLSGSHRVISGLQFGVRFVIPESFVRNPQEDEDAIARSLINSSSGRIVATERESTCR